MAKAKSNKTKEIGEDNGVDISEENGPQQRSSDMDAVEMRANPDQAEIAHNIPEQILEDGVIPITMPAQYKTFIDFLLLRPLWTVFKCLHITKPQLKPQLLHEVDQRL